MWQDIIHYFLHFGLPLIIAGVFFRKQWVRAYLIFLATMLVDADHLLAAPVLDPDRCSINFHPLHTYYAMAVYVILLFLKRPWNLIGLGLLLHMATDFTDCLMTYRRCADCMIGAPAYDILRTISDFF